MNIILEEISIYIISNTVIILWDDKETTKSIYKYKYNNLIIPKIPNAIYIMEKP